MAEAAVAIGIALWTTYSKARSTGTTLFSGPGRRFVYSFAPPLFVGVLLTILLFRIGSIAELGGRLAASVRHRRWCGRCAVFDSHRAADGAVLYGAGHESGSISRPPGWGNAFLGIGFGGLHVIFGAVIAGKYGG